VADRGLTAILLSGGIDSVASTYWKRPDLAITIDYGQVPAEAEIQASQAVCHDLSLRHEVITIDCRSIGSGDLAGRPALNGAPASEWWPYRNQLLITIAASCALTKGFSKLLVGTVASDGFHTDGTPEFIELIAALLRLQEGGMQLEAPAMRMSSVQLVRETRIPIEVLAWAHSCHVSNFACGRCRGCVKHFEVTQELGIGPY
jgi:7-cyano-7-deazaguanine synthase